MVAANQQARIVALADEIRRRRLSRNRNFTLLSRPEYRQARRVQRYLDSLAEELSTLHRAGTLALQAETAPDGRMVLLVGVPHLGLLRRCYLVPEELGYLETHHRSVAALIAAVIDLPQRCDPDVSARRESQGDESDV